MKLPYYQKKPQSLLAKNSANIILLCGLFFTFIVLYLFFSQYLFMKKAQIAMGKVIAFEVPKNKSLRVPVIEYIGSDNKTHVYRHFEGTNPPSYRIGERVKVYCNPTDSEDNKLGFSFIPMIILLIFGSLFLLIGYSMK